jgi:hypothetical protein
MVDDPKDPRNRADRISEAYSRAAEGRQKQAQPERRESDMVKQSAPGMDMRPSGPMRDGADRQAHNERLQAERAKEAKAREMQEAIRKRETEKSKDRDRER